MFENDLEQANTLILKLKQTKTEDKSSKFELNDLNTKLVELNNLLESSNRELEDKEKQLDSLKLEIKNQQQDFQHERLMQLQEEKQERQEIAKLNADNVELRAKLDEKLSEINLLGEQINELNTNINAIKSNDSALFNELQQKTEQFLSQIDTANQEIASLRSENEALAEQRKQFEFVLDEKTREISRLRLDLEQHVQHIGAQSKALEKLQSDLKQTGKETTENAAQPEQNDQDDELSMLKVQYNQMYAYLEQKNHESLSYYNEIQRLNLIISELNRELFNSKALNENLNEQYDNLLKGFQLEQKMVDDLNQQTSELTTTLLSIKQEADQNSHADVKNEDKQDSEKKLSHLKDQYELKINDLNSKLNQMSIEREDLISKLNNSTIERDNLISSLNDFNLKFSQTESYYENALKSQSDAFKATLSSEEQQRLKLVKELERLKEHLVEMSDNYNKDAIQAEEREKQLRTALNDAQSILQQQGANLESSR